MSFASLNVSEIATDDMLSDDEMDFIVERATYTMERM